MRGLRRRLPVRRKKSEDALTATAVRANRLRVRRWADLRLWMGVVLVVVAMFAGARLLSHGTQTVAVWQAERDLSVGSQDWQLRPVSVSLGAASGDYIPATEQPRGSLRVPVAAGELLPRSAFVTESHGPTRTVTVGVDPLHAPIDLRPGDVVDVWSTPGSNSADADLVPTLVLEKVSVEQVGDGAVGMGGQLAVVLRVHPGEVTNLVRAARAGAVDLVTVPVDSQGPLGESTLAMAESS